MKCTFKHKEDKVCNEGSLVSSVEVEIIVSDHARALVELEQHEWCAHCDEFKGIAEE